MLSYETVLHSILLHRLSGYAEQTEQRGLGFETAGAE